jgi:hypothetical protein
LHRIGQGWAPRRLALEDAYLVDQLLAALRPLDKPPENQRRHG